MPVRGEHKGDFDGLEIYRASTELVTFVYELEDRFPEDEMGVLFHRLRSAAVDVGAKIAEGFGRDGVDAGGRLSEPTRRETRARLSELRHYVMTARQRFFLDERQVESFEEIYRKISGDLGPEASD